jgi:hypothetical protein
MWEAHRLEPDYQNKIVEWWDRGKKKIWLLFQQDARNKNSGNHLNMKRWKEN